jgi:hypothetical protein
LEPIEGAITSNANKPLDAEALEPAMNGVELILVLWIHVISRRTQNGSTFGRIQLRDFLKQRVKVHMGQVWVVEAVESLNQPIGLEIELVGPLDGSVDGGVQGRGVTACGQNTDAFHWVVGGLWSGCGIASLAPLHARVGL